MTYMGGRPDEGRCVGRHGLAVVRATLMATLDRWKRQSLEGVAIGSKVEEKKDDVDVASYILCSHG